MRWRGSRARPSPPEQRAAALRDLAALLALGHAPRGALASWYEQERGPLREVLERVARRLRLGASIQTALEVLEPVFEADTSLVTAAFSVQARLGGDLAGMMSHAAAGIARRSAQLSSARAAAAGARTSGRIVAGLPFLLVPLLPLARAPLLDGPGIALFVSGVSLAACGLVCIERLVPRVSEHDDTAARLADQVVAVLRGGASLHVALAVASDNSGPGSTDHLRRAAARATLGLTWSEALAHSEDEGLRCMSAEIGRAQSTGMPLADMLEVFAEARRAHDAHRLEEAARRAPVLMVVPLALFVLPAFVLLGVVPFLRSMSIAP